MTGLQLRALAVRDLVANRGNVREHLDGIDELAASIRAQGVLQPLIVNDRDGTLIVTDGHRRLEAARRAGLPRVMCIVSTDADERTVVATMLAASMHRELKPIEQARAFQRLVNEGLTRADIARTTGYTVALITSRLALLALPPEAQQMVEDQQITIGQANKLAKTVKATRTGSAAKTATRSAWFTRSHRLALAVANCPHAAARTLVGGVACGQCWEQAIRDDTLGTLIADPPHDEVVVERVLAGERLPMSRADRLEAIRRLHARRWSDSRIALQLGCTARQVIRDRQALDLPGIDLHDQDTGEAAGHDGAHRPRKTA